VTTKVLLPLALATVCAAGLSLPARAMASAAMPAPRLETAMTSALATSMLRGASDVPAILRGSASVPELWLAQRTIDRQWGLSDDSTYRTVDVQGWKSEGLALGLSGVLPGTGQLYAGEGSGWFYLAAEAAGWAGRVLLRHKGDDLRDQAAAYVGDPNDSTSAWSFDRYARTTGGSASRLRVLWNGDRESYYQALATDPSYRPGFGGTNPSTTFETYRDFRSSSQDKLHQAAVVEVGLWLNHALSAFDALRAAHFHNLPLTRSLGLQLDGNFRHREPSLRAALVRRF